MTSARILAAAVVLGVVAAGPASAFAPEVVHRVVLSPRNSADYAAIVAAGVDLSETRPTATKKGTRWAAIVSPAELSVLQKAGVPAAVFETYTPKNPFAANQPATPSFGSGYHTYAAMLTEVQARATAFPSLVTLSTIGNSWQTINQGANRPLWAVRVASGTGKPPFFVHAAHHSREIATPEVALFFLQLLAQGYGQDALLTYLVDQRETWILPMVNPDGHVEVESNGPLGNGYLQRKNMNTVDGNCTGSNPGIDINRNYAFQWNGCGVSTDHCSDVFPGPSGGSEPETQAMQAFFASKPFLTGISLHTWAAMVIYPWSYQSVPTADAAVFYAFGGRMADLMNAVGPIQPCGGWNPGTSYIFGQTPDILYCVSGGADDYAYSQNGIFHFTIELDGGDSCDFWPSYTAVIQSAGMWDRVRPALVYALNISDAPATRARAPMAGSLVLSPALTIPGAPVAVTAAFDNTRNGPAVTAAQYWVDAAGPDGSGTPLSVGAGGNVASATGSLATGSLSMGRHVVYARGQEAGGRWGSISAAWLDVSNVTATPTHTATPGPAATATRTPTAAVAIFPNPADAGGTGIFFSGLERQTAVRIFDIAGEEVRVLSSPATGLLRWDLRNKAGQDVARGVYVAAVYRRSFAVWDVFKLAVR